MSQFNPKQALDICLANVKARKQRSGGNKYVLYYYHNTDVLEGTMVGSTIKTLIDEFRASGGAYRYAFITKKGDHKVLRFFDRNENKKFFSMTRGVKK